jgi:hypothetical protein
VGNQLRHSRPVQAASTRRARRHERWGAFDRPIFHREARPLHELRRCGRDGAAMERPILP